MFSQQTIGNTYSIFRYLAMILAERFDNIQIDESTIIFGKSQMKV